MTEATHLYIRKLMKEQGIWNHTMQIKIYTVEELFKEVGEERFTAELKTLLLQYVGRVQMYCDDRVLEPKN